MSWECKRQLVEALVSAIRVDTVETCGVVQPKVTITYRFEKPNELERAVPTETFLRSAIRIPVNPETVGDHLRLGRLKLKLMQKQLATRLGINKGTIHNWEPATVGFASVVIFTDTRADNDCTEPKTRGDANLTAVASGRPVIAEPQELLCSERMQRRIECFAGVVVALGLALRLTEAARTYLNPDEIQYFFLSVPGNFKALFLSGLQVDHPPLLFFLLHPVVTVASSEFVLRLIPVLAGGLFPWVVYRWLSGIWNAAAGLTALCILALSPNLISLSAQVRGYTLELLFAALALLFLDTAIREGSLGAMIAFDIALLLTILSEYSAVWFAAAAAIYFLLRNYQRRLPLRLAGAWVVGQLAAFALCAVLFWTSIKPRLGYWHGAAPGYLTSTFPAPHQNLLVFSALGTVKQFAYTFSSPILGIGAAVLFLICLLPLLKGRTEESQAQDRALAILLVAPFFLVCAGAVLRVQPYGRSRHSVILALFVAAGVSIGIERLVRLRLPFARLGAGAAALAVAWVWLFAAVPDFDDIPDYRHHKDSMAAAIRYIQSSVPPGSLVLADQETTRSLRFYWSSGQQLRRLAILDEPDGPPIGSLRVVYRRWDFGSVKDFLGDLASVRSEFGLSGNAPVWVVDGGFNAGIVARLRDRFPGVTLPLSRDFDGAIAVFQTPPGI